MSLFDMAVTYQLDPRRAPIRVVELELADHPTARPAAGREPAEGWLDGRVLALVRLHHHPLGVIQADIEARDGTDTALAMLAQTARTTFADAIATHLRSDQNSTTTANGTPPCLRRRHALLHSPPTISVIVATRERPEELARCLESITTVDYPHFEVIVVDNAPTTDAAEHLIHDRFTTVTYTKEPIRGLASAHNHALKLATGKIIAFADDDVVVDRHWLAAIAEAFTTGDHVGCVTGLIPPAELDTPEQVLLEAHGGFMQGFHQHRYNLQQAKADPRFPFNAGTWGSGANMAFTAAALHDIGGFDPALGAGTPTRAGDESLAFLQVVLAGYDLLYQPDAIAWHTHPRTQTDLASRASGYGTGLTAYLTAVILHEPQILPAVLRRIPPGIVRRLRRHRAASNGAALWPGRLSVLERHGLAYGPLAYARSRWRLSAAAGLLAGRSRRARP